jgi:predicted DNA binding protein
MSVIVELTVPSEAFELGQVLRVEAPAQIALETMVPLGGRPTPFVRSRDDIRQTFEASVRGHSSVDAITEVNTHNGETLYALQWNPSPDSFLRTIMEMGAVLLNASGDATQWGLEVRFPDYETLSSFQEYYVGREIAVTIERMYNPTKPDAGPWYGLTRPQREALTAAVENGYYALPREISTKELADGFGISDQAMTERLRRGITALVSNTLLAVDDEE